MYYGLLISGAVIFAIQLVVTKFFQKSAGTKLKSTFILSSIGFLFIALFFLIKGTIDTGSFHLDISWFTLLMTALIAIVSFLQIFASIQTLKVGEMSLYSIFLEIGNMLIPSLVGMIFLKESVSVLKIISLIVMIVAVIFSADGIRKGKMSKKAFFYYLLCLLSNGLIGSLFAIHQAFPELTAGASLIEGKYIVDTNIFMTWYGITTFVISLVALLVCIILDKNVTKEKLPTKTICLILLLPILYGLCNGVGNYFVALATSPDALGASVTFPIVDGGVILFSTVIGVLLYKEKLTLNKIISIVLVIGASIMLMFA